MQKPFLSLLFLACVCSIFGQQTEMKFVRETNYLLSVPDGYDRDTSKRWPLMMFLHGSGESGNDVKKIAANGPPKLINNGKKYPFIVVSPQNDVPNGWDVDMLYKLLQQVKKNYRVDNNRIYLTGLSMGGFGTWSLAMKHPEEFAAIAPICGGGDTTDAWRLRNIPIWCFHGAKDDVVAPVNSDNFVKAAKNYNKQVRYTLYPEANHNSWDVTYDNDSLYTWMLGFKKFSYTEKPMDSLALKQYEGVYYGNGDTIRVKSTHEGLIAFPPHERVPLKPVGNNVFYIVPDQPLEVRFMMNGKKSSGFWFWGDQRVFFKKIG